MPVMVGRCEVCGGSFELPLVFDPLTWRTSFDPAAMAKHQGKHTATATTSIERRRRPRPEPDPTAP